MTAANQPTRAAIRQALAQMVSGECRYIVEKRVHVYCHAPLVAMPCPVNGRTTWSRGPRWFRVECPGVFEPTPEQLFSKQGDGAWREEGETVDRILEALAAPALPPRESVPYGRGLTKWERMRDLYPVAGAPQAQPTTRSQPATVPFPVPEANQAQPTQRRLFA